MNTVKTTKIEKKWKDKKTGEMKTLTIDYAKVKDRLLAFWEENPRGSIDTTPSFLEDGKVLFVASLKTDQGDPFSKQAKGSALSGEDGEKNFEKLETIAVGRALALLGYAVTGEIASSEEMERFQEYKQERKKNALESLKEAKTLEELRKTYLALGSLMADKDILVLKDTLKTTLK